MNKELKKALTERFEQLKGRSGTEPLEDGVYLIYADHYEKFNGNNSKDGVKYIGIIHDAHTIAAGLKELGEHRLPKKDNFKDDGWKYVNGDVFAMADFNGKANTEHLKKHGEFDFKLNAGEWLPSIGELAMIVLLKDEVNAALEYVGGDSLECDCYWSSSEYSADGAWYINFRFGDLYSSLKANNYSGCRPVAAFEL